MEWLTVCPCGVWDHLSVLLALCGENPLGSGEFNPQSDWDSIILCMSHLSGMGLGCPYSDVDLLVYLGSIHYRYILPVQETSLWRRRSCDHIIYMLGFSALLPILVINLYIEMGPWFLELSGYQKLWYLLYGMNELSLVFDGVGFQLSTPSHCRERIKIYVNVFLIQFSM